MIGFFVTHVGSHQQITSLTSLPLGLYFVLHKSSRYWLTYHVI